MHGKNIKQFGISYMMIISMNAKKKNLKKEKSKKKNI